MAELSAFLAQKTMAFPPELPLDEPYLLHPVFYVRACYADYYDRAMAQLMTTRGVTITGTSGIGKSVFMGYFFLRYTLAFPDITVIAMAYNKGSELEKAVVWDKRHHSITTVSPEHNIQALAMQYKHDPQAIFLIDGAPDMKPASCHRYVVFASNTSKTWIRKMEPIQSHCMLVMPVWHKDELVDAVEILDLDTKLGRMPDVDAFPRASDRHTREVLYRYDVFGGVARVCLACNPVFVELRLQKLEQVAARIDTSAVRRAMRDFGGLTEEEHDCLFHDVPWNDNLGFSSVQIASPYARQLLSEQLGVFETTRD